MREYRVQKLTTTETVETVAKPTAKDDSKQKDRNSETVETRKGKRKSCRARLSQMREYRIQKETTTETVETVAKPTAVDDSKQKDRNSETVDNVA